VDVHHGHSDVGKAVSWLLNDDTEAADVMAYLAMSSAPCEGFLIFGSCATWESKSLLGHITSHWSGVQDEIHLVRRHHVPRVHIMKANRLVRLRPEVPTSAAVVELTQSDFLVVCASNPMCCPVDYLR